MPFLLITLLLMLLGAATAGPDDPPGNDFTCVFYRSFGQVTCGTITCYNVQPQEPSSLLSLGLYGNGPQNYDQLPLIWYNLYPHADGHFGDFHTDVPALGCRGGFAFHDGTYSEDCITVTDNARMESIANYFNAISATSFTVNKCAACPGYNCL